MAAVCPGPNSLIVFNVSQGSYLNAATSHNAAVLMQLYVSMQLSSVQQLQCSCLSAAVLMQLS